MQVAIIKNGLCDNVAVFNSLEDAFDLLGNLYDDLIELPEGGKIGDEYINGEWIKQKNINEISIFCPNCQNVIHEALDNCPICGFDISRFR
jgi:rubrerythrin